MVTTIQVQQQTLELLKKIKEEVNAGSYDEAIKNIVIARTNKESLAGFLRGVSLQKALKDLEKLRSESDRF